MYLNVESVDHVSAALGVLLPRKSEVHLMTGAADDDQLCLILDMALHLPVASVDKS